MKKEIFDEMVINKLLAASNSGDAVNSAGAKLVGHRPEIAPKAYAHAIFKGLEEKDISDMELGLGMQLSPMLKNFFKFANGMMIFSGSLRVLGYIPKGSNESGVYDYPSNILTPNISARIDGLLEDDLVVGWYKKDGSNAIVRRNGEVSKFDVLGSGEEIQRWVDFDNWLVSEINELHKNYKY